MFPSELATGICSLNPQVDRLVQSCLMEVDRHGSVVRDEFHDGVINTAARMTYTDVNAILTTRAAELMSGTATLVPKFQLMGELFHDPERRAASGAGRSTSTCPKPKSSSTMPGAVEAIVEAERNVAHKLIEEFMLLANETVATLPRRARHAVRCIAFTSSRTS